MTIRSNQPIPYRAAPSLPTQWAYANGYVQSVVLDWGCGKSPDAHWLLGLGFETIAYDPFHKPQPHPNDIDFSTVKTILLNYVINVLEPDVRVLLLQEIAVRAAKDTRLVVAARTHCRTNILARRYQWTRHSDGYLTGARTFQSGFTTKTLKALCEPFGTILKTVARSDSIICVIELKKKT